MPRWWGWLAWAVFAVVQAGWLVWAAAAAFSPTGRYDFASYYAAARALRLDLHANIYADAVIHASGAAVHIMPFPYTYPPLAAILLVPLTWLAFATAAHVWLLLNLVLWQGCLLMLAREAAFILRDALPAPSWLSAMPAQPRGWWDHLLRWWRDPVVALACALSALVFVVARPAAETITLGQINFVVLLPLALVPWLLRIQRDTWVGVAIACAAMIKITPILLLAYLWLRGRTQALVSGLVTLGLLALFSLVVVGPPTMLALVGQVRRISGMDAALPQNEALFAVPLRLVGVNLPTLVSAAHTLQYAGLVLVACALGSWLYLRRNDRHAQLATTKTSHQDAATYALALCALLLLSPATWAHHYLWLLPALVLALALSLRQVLLAEASTRHAAQRRFRVVVAAWLVIACTTPFELDGQPLLRTTLILGLSLTDWSHWLRPLATLLMALQLATFVPTPPIWQWLRLAQIRSTRTA